MYIDMMQFKSNIILILLLLVTTLSGCASSPSRYSIAQDHAPKQDINVSKIPNAVPRVEPKSKYGNPESYVVRGKRYRVMKTATGFKQKGIASWYGKKFHGHRTSSGESYNMYAMTAAHKNLPLPSYVHVTNLDNGRSVIVRVNDRGPFHASRIIDLSYAAAKKLGITPTGTSPVEIRVIDPRQRNRRTRVSAIDHFKKKTPSSTTTPAVTQKAAAQVYLQVGAFSKRNNADELCEQLASLLTSGNINTGYNVENKLYRVRIGPLNTTEEASQIAARISQAGIAQAKIVYD